MKPSVVRKKLQLPVVESTVNEVPPISTPFGLNARRMLITKLNTKYIKTNRFFSNLIILAQLVVYVRL